MVKNLIIEKNGAYAIEFVTARIIGTGEYAPAMTLVTPTRSYTCGLSKRELMDIREWCTRYLEE